jgi:ABC-type iron transport system FetAB permease component
MGPDPRNWIFPRVLTYLILLVAALLVVRVVLAAVAKRAPDMLRASKEDWRIFVDLVVFCAIVLAYILVVNGLGFWLASFLMLSIASIYLTPKKTPRNIGLAFVVPFVACVLAYLVFLRLFYVPVPEATWWPGLG